MRRTVGQRHIYASKVALSELDDLQFMLKKENCSFSHDVQQEVHVSRHHYWKPQRRGFSYVPCRKV
jgi:hypothetical protein